MSLFTRIHHVGIAVTDMDAAIIMYRDQFMMKTGLRRTMETQGVEVQFMDLPGSKIELLAPLSEDSTVARFLASHGPGVHHLAYESDDIYDSLKYLQNNDFKLIDEEPREGAEGKLVAFVHPRSAGGVLIELQQA